MQPLYNDGTPGDVQEGWPHANGARPDDVPMSVPPDGTEVPGAPTNHAEDFYPRAQSHHQASALLCFGRVTHVIARRSFLHPSIAVEMTRYTAILHMLPTSLVTDFTILYDSGDQILSYNTRTSICPRKHLPPSKHTALPTPVDPHCTPNPCSTVFHLTVRWGTW